MVTAAEVKAPNTETARDSDVPTAFVSYSWDSPEHKEWVLELAKRLRSQGGVRVILDCWDLQVGGDRTHFMEKNIRESDFVLLICTPAYASKSNKRTGGVGYEAMVITSQLALQITQNKFIPVLRQGEWDDSAIPIWLQTKIGVDFRGEPYDEEQYQLLLRAIHHAQITPPAIGPKPIFQDDAYMQDDGVIGNAVTAVLKSAGEGTAALHAVTDNLAQKEMKQSPIAYAFYEKKGTDSRVHVYVRPVGSSDKICSFETSTGEYEEGIEKQIEQRYVLRDLDLKQEGYTRMQSFNGSGGLRFSLP